ncbi:MAG: hypothetical protein EOP86_21055 [Verrucomicrobiaceae bacterium]|nr:MAG: hypothetical protein EOP86_21055 [Verrucomicrobiaceae bacterium]
MAGQSESWHRNGFPFRPEHDAFRLQASRFFGFHFSSATLTSHAVKHPGKAFSSAISRSKPHAAGTLFRKPGLHCYWLHGLCCLKRSPGAVHREASSGKAGGFACCHKRPDFERIRRHAPLPAWFKRTCPRQFTPKSIPFFAVLWEIGGKTAIKK